jgi:hypothetical protein
VDRPERAQVASAEPVPAGQSQHPSGTATVSTPLPSGAGDASSSAVTVAAPAGAAIVPAQGAATTPPIVLGPLPRPHLHHREAVGVTHASTSPLTAQGSAPATPRSRFAAVASPVRRAYFVTDARPASAPAAAAASPSPATAPTGSTSGVGAAAAAAGAAASGAGLWLSLVALASLALFFSRLTSLPAVSRPVPFISLLERPG